MNTTMDRAIRQLTRSRNERVFAGVCGGIAVYFGLDPVLVRVLYVALTILSNGLGGVLVYIIGWFVIPLEPEGEVRPYSPRESLGSRRSIIVIGAFLLTAGLIALVTPFFPAFWDVWDIRWLGPVILVIAGIGLIFWQRTQGNSSSSSNSPNQEQEIVMSDSQSTQAGSSLRRLIRARDGRKIAGVCAGFGTYFNIDPTIVRLIWLAMLFLFGTGLLLYIICWIVMPLEPESRPVQSASTAPPDQTTGA